MPPTPQGTRDSVASPNHSAPGEHQLKSATVYLETVAQQVDDVVRLCVTRFAQPPRGNDGREKLGVVGGEVADAVAALAELRGVLDTITSVTASIEHLETRRATQLSSTSELAAIALREYLHESDFAATPNSRTV